MRKDSFISGIIAAIAIIALAVVAVPRSNHAEASTQTHKITVIGHGTVNAVPDEGVVRLGVNSRASSVTSAQSANDKTMQSVIAALKKLGIAAKDIRTQNYNIMPTYGDHGQRTGYQVVDEVAATVHSTSLAGKVIAAATRAGANQVQGVTWKVSKTSSQLSAEAYVNALDSAKTTAHKLAASMHATITGIDSISVLSASTTPVRHMAFSASAKAMSTAPIQPGQQPMTADLRVVFAYK